MKLLDYVRDCGDEGFGQRPFCEADNLALSLIVYLDLAGCVPPLRGGTVTLRHAWKEYLRLHDRNYIYSLSGLGTQLAPFVLQAMAESPRFSGLRLGGFACIESSERHEQFAALYAALPDGTAYVAFRGTDSTLAGWREDFMLSYQVVAAQRHALGYLERVAELVDDGLMVGGHSKGGNLAAFASAFAPEPVRARITDVWCNDSPGFDRAVVDFSKLAFMASRVHLFVPGFCVVGALMEHVAKPVVVHSTDPQVMQHAMTGWELDEEGNLERLTGISPDARRIGYLFDQLIKGRNLAERKVFVSDVFDALSATGAGDLEGLVALGPAGVEKVIGHLASADPDTREATRKLLTALMGEMVRSSLTPASAGAEDTAKEPLSVEGMRRHRARQKRAQGRKAPVTFVRAILGSDLLRDYVTLGLGLLVLANAGDSAPVVAYLMVTSVAVYSVLLLARYVVAVRTGEDADIEDLLIGIITAVPAVAVLFFRVAVSALYNLVLAGGLLAWGVSVLRKKRIRSGNDLPRVLRQAGTYNALLSIALSFMLFVNPTELTHWLLLISGIYIAAQGIWGLISRE